MHTAHWLIWYPIDLILDLTPFIGYTDMALITAALSVGGVLYRPLQLKNRKARSMINEIFN